MKVEKVNEKSNTFRLLINQKIYPIDIVMDTCLVFIDKYYVFLDIEKGKIRIDLKPKEGVSKGEIKDIAGEFSNELLNQTIRKKINAQHSKIREYIVSKALFSADLIRDFSSDEFLEEEFEEIDDDYLDDPLQIAVPWEEKYGKNKKKNENNKIS